ncbi:uncharacterized protein MELLADRAFT_108539 [Melampsora larici-populina 98AG31]|uniref:Uncharacterized protein n=1 Tax=Melampsora larici-populina (strain 98AG31 / pathotype 3-4-7) TaxID=747676 RepID=F4RTE9_MELLP|nr:uncharacterized protein MELLADRAFT_108539 [Melampsora larici-populina 98AG31]EGG04351.1 hypothetical protein MELLADRAFT_108539 [Melampsora larici-populina 98AG31]
MRRTPPVTRNRGSQQGSPSQRGSPSFRGSSRGSRGQGNTQTSAESAPPEMPTNQQDERSPTLTPVRPHQLSFDNFIGKSLDPTVHTRSNIHLRLQRLDKLAPTVENFTRTMAKLDSDGTNFHTWLEEANANVYFLIGKADYLNHPSNPANQIHPEINHAENTIAYWVIYYSVTPEL